MTVQTTLQLGSETSTVLCTEDDRVVLQQELPLGTASLARQWMRHTPPTPLDIEHAIEQTEDVVMPLAAHLARTEQLQLRGSGAALILQGVGAAPDATLQWNLDEVEDLFNRNVDDLQKISPELRFLKEANDAMHQLERYWTDYVSRMY